MYSASSKFYPHTCPKHNETASTYLWLYADGSADNNATI